jgi:hypothetical protein
MHDPTRLWLGDFTNGHRDLDLLGPNLNVMSLGPHLRSRRRRWPVARPGELARQLRAAESGGSLSELLWPPLSLSHSTDLYYRLPAPHGRSGRVIAGP